jgi:hypothetical protein
MSAFKQFLSTDVIVSPLVVNKSFSFEGSASFINNIDRLLGVNINPSSSLQASTQITSSISSSQLYNSVKQLYYTNYIPNPISGSPYIIDFNGNVIEDTTQTDVYSRFYNYESTTLFQTNSLGYTSNYGFERYFPTESNAQIGVISISKNLFGDYINPNSLDFSTQQFSYLPDVFLSASLTASLIKDDNNITSIIDSNPYITWSENTDSLGWFNGGQLILLNNISFPIDLYIEVTASNSVSTTDITIAVCTGSNYTDSISTHTFSSFPSNYEFIISLDETYVGNSQIISLFPIWNISDPSSASVNLNIKMRMYKSSIPPLKIKDNGEGLIYKSGSSDYVGVINYSHGTIVITDGIFSSFTSSNDVTCSFQSSRTIYETQYKCTIRPDEFNFSLNPSLISGSTEGTVYNFVTSSYFSPYVTTVGFYNEAQELMMVAKLGQPLPTSQTTDTTILVNIDK